MEELRTKMEPRWSLGEYKYDGGTCLSYPEQGCSQGLINSVVLVARVQLLGMSHTADTHFTFLK